MHICGKCFFFLLFWFPIRDLHPLILMLSPSFFNWISIRIINIRAVHSFSKYLRNSDCFWHLMNLSFYCDCEIYKCQLCEVMYMSIKKIGFKSNDKKTKNNLYKTSAINVTSIYFSKKKVCTRSWKFDNLSYKYQIVIYPGI